MLPTIRVIEHDDPAEREAILQPLIAYNLKSAPDPKYQLLGLLLQDEDGATIGGLWGRSAYEWLFVELLFVPEHLRGTGLGSQLIHQAEDIARERAAPASGSTPSISRRCPSTKNSATPSSDSSRTTPAACRNTGCKSASTALSSCSSRAPGTAP